MKNHKRNYWPNTTQMLLLKAALSEPPIAIKSWEKWVSQTDINHIDAISYQLMPSIYKNLSSLPAEFSHQQLIKGIYKHTWMNNQLAFHALLTTLQNWSLINSQKIVLLKGAAMLAGYYTNWGMRVIGDIDILVPKPIITEFMHYLYDSGYTPFHASITKKSLDSLSVKHAICFNHPDSFSPLKIDVHVTPLSEIPFSQETSSHWVDEAVALTLQGLKIYRLNPTDLLFQTCIHGVKYSEVPLLRWIMDATTLIEKEYAEINWNQLKWYSRKYDLVLPMQHALNGLSEHFTKKIPKDVLSDLNKMPISLVNKLEFEWKTKDRNQLLKIPLLLWLKSRRHKKYFFQYLKELWGLKSPLQVPFIGGLKFINFIRKEVRRKNDQCYHSHP